MTANSNISLSGFSTWRQKVKPDTVFERNIAIEGNVIGTANLFGKTNTIYRDKDPGNAISRVSYSWYINADDHLQLIKTYSFNDSNQTTISRVASTFGTGEIPITAMTNTEVSPVFTNKETNNGHI